MKTFLVVLGNGEKLYVKGDKLIFRDGCIHIDGEYAKDFAIIPTSALIVDVSSIDKDAAKEYGFQFSIG